MFNRLMKMFLLATCLGSLLGCPCKAVDGPGDPRIEFTFVPSLGSFANLRGNVSHIALCDFVVAVYIGVETNGLTDPTGLFGSRISFTYWTKPTFSEPLTSIQGNGSFVTDITTGGVDETAQKIIAFLIPVEYDPPLLSGASSLPDELFENAVAITAVERSSEGIIRLLYISGFEWKVKASDTPVGPGPNTFSDRVENVWLDEEGNLHLRITEENGVYKTAEIISKNSFGYGTYVFHMASPVDDLDPNVVLGLFTWSDDPAFDFREMDIEFSRWQDPLNDNAQYVVQPWDTPGNLDRFDIGPESTTTHGFTWQSDSITFRSIVGDDFFPEEPAALIHEWVYTGADIPVPGGENVRMNLWLVFGEPPTDGKESEVVISRFEFIPD